MTRFTIRFTGLNKALHLLGMTRGSSYVEVDAGHVAVRMGPWFRTRFERGQVVSADETPHPMLLGWGVHGWRGRWLVNGSSSGIVRLRLEPDARARVIGVPVRLRELLVAVDDPTGLLATLARRG
jgi:hypothetical protein